MADVPFYLQGSQTGGLLQNLQQQQTQQQIPSGGYTPGQGMAPLAAPADPGPFPTTNNNGEQEAWYRAKQAQLSNNYTGTGQGPLSTFPGGNASTPGAPAGISANNNGYTTIGQADPWLTPEQLGAKTNSVSTPIYDEFHKANAGGSGGGGGGGGGGSSDGTDPNAASSGGNGLNLSGSGANTGANGGNPAFTSSLTPVTPTVGYTAPGGAPSQGQPGVLQMQQANPQAALDQYKNTPGYQLLNAPGAYQQSPGYQYAMDQAMQQANQGASAHGMLESGAVIKQMQQTASGLAQQDYGNWWNRQNQLYGDYQNRLQGLAGGNTGSADAMTNGANQAQGTLQTGSNLGSLFGNQGTSGMGGIINTGAAQANAMSNAGTQQAQVNAANQATQLAGATLASNQNKGLF